MITDSQKSIIYLAFAMFFSYAYIANPESLSLVLYPHVAPAHSLSLMVMNVIGPAIIMVSLLSAAIYGFNRLNERVNAIYFVHLALSIFGLLGFCAGAYRLWYF